MKILDGKIMLCGGKKCCPQLSITKEGQVQIIDDGGHTVLMDKSQARLINEALDQFERGI